MVKNVGVRELATQALNTTGDQLHRAVEHVGEVGLSRVLVRAAQFSGLPGSRVSRAAASQWRVPVDKLPLLGSKPSATAKGWKPNATAKLSRELMDIIAGLLDGKTLTDFAQCDRRFAEIAGDLVRGLTFERPDEMRYGMAYLADKGRSRFSELHLQKLTLTHAQYDLGDLETIPAVARESIQFLVLDRSLTEAGWRFLDKLPNLREVRMLQSNGYDAAEVVRLPKSLVTLQLLMPTTRQALEHLEQFPALETVEVAMLPDSSLGEVLEPFGLSTPSDESAEENDANDHGGGALSNVTMTALRFHQDQRCEETDIVRLPTSLRTLTLPHSLTEAGWRFLDKLPNLREVRMLQSNGYNAAEVVRLPKSLVTLQLLMPTTRQALEHLEQFPALETVEVTMLPESSLGEVLEQLGLSTPSDGSAEENDANDHGGGALSNVTMTALTFDHDQLFEDADIAKLPVSLRELTLPWCCNLSATAFELLHGVALRSLDVSQSPNLSGAVLEVILQHPTLRRFRSAASNLTASDAKAIAASPRLTAVELPYNSMIGDVGIKALLANTRIDVLNIGRCGGSDRLVLDLNRQAPLHLRQLTLQA